MARLRPYSRLARTEEKRNTRQAVLFVVLTIVALVLLVGFGLPTIAKFAVFLTGLKESSLPIDKNDTTPPAPPQLNLLPEATKDPAIEISGSAEEGATVVLFLNGKKEEILVGSDSKFFFNFQLNKGENTVSAQTIDRAGNESLKTEKLTVRFDNEAPSLEILSPEDGKEFFGSRQRQVTIEGQTESGVKLTVNDRLILVDNEGSFAYAATLQEGENTFLVKAQDKAGNNVESSLTLRFSL